MGKSKGTKEKRSGSHGAYKSAPALTETEPTAGKSPADTAISVSTESTPSPPGCSGSKGWMINHGVFLISLTFRSLFS